MNVLAGASGVHVRASARWMWIVFAAIVAWAAMLSMVDDGWGATSPVPSGVTVDGAGVGGDEAVVGSVAGR